MKTPGPPPKPTALRKLEGDRSNRPARPPEPKPEAAPLGAAPPAFLDEEGCAEWARMYQVLHRLGLLTICDLTTFAIYCAIYSRCVKAETQLRRGPDLVKTPSGYVQQSPWYSIAARSEDQFKGYLALFGLSPADRTRLLAGVPMTPRHPEDDDDEPPPQFEAGEFTGLIGKMRPQ